jgi:hypothetical protein
MIDLPSRTPQVEPAYQSEQNGRIGSRCLGSAASPKLGWVGTLSFAYHPFPRVPTNLSAFAGGTGDTCSITWFVLEPSI